MVSGKSCPPPPIFDPAETQVITNATVNTRAFETVLYYKCADGYWFDKYSEGQTRYITCQYDKSWTGIEGIVECSSKSTEAALVIRSSGVSNYIFILDVCVN